MKKKLAQQKLNVDYVDKTKKNSVFFKSWKKQYGVPLEMALQDFLARHFSQVELFEFSIVLCGGSRIRRLNKEFRNKDKVTDVLSFQAHEDLRGRSFSQKSFEKFLHLGDIFVCMPVAQKQAKQLGVSLNSELVHLIIHGALHLCGYDHEISAKEEKIMLKLEDALLNTVRLNRTKKRLKNG